MGVLQGKKTYLAGGLLMLLGVASFLTQTGDADTAAGMVIAGFGLIGLGAKAERHRREIVDTLELVKAAIEKRPLTTEEKAALAGDVLAIGAEAATTPMLSMAGASLPEASAPEARG
ncbi:hypothetical protein Acid345_3402 [Candidatus Koribacter versatilis Ellin345]|uniref:Uncharacterized protein n=1 Tax=Koribacter versatilis (strain Ellin345) TaxID=204669 RepID=Q1IL47_KORVE|nr:hypothetical protein [Candidatus Koribacter versatilis]ABF42403.1 hypothetical protein Acid345_3402 [Candidatus Koribacter versatilis Ellin345]